MEFLVLVCHPNPKSFSHALAAECEKALREAEVGSTRIDLYREQFDPALTVEELQRRFSFDAAVQRYARLVTEATGFIVVHPDWWGMPPALLKGFIDRVFRPGVAYDYEGPDFVTKTRVPLLTGKRALVFCASDVPDASDDARSRDQALTRWWAEAVFGYCGMKETRVRLFAGMRESTLRRRREWLAEARQSTRHWVSNFP